MKKFKFYTTDWAPNGTSDLIICDRDDQVVQVIGEALFGPPVESEDRLGNVTVLMHGENIGMLDYSDEENDLEAVLAGEYSDLIPVGELTKAQVFDFIAVSPFDPEGQGIIEQLNTLGIKE